jgi:hypothetical protein
MANLFIAYRNRWDEATISATSELTTLPVSNTQIEHLAQLFRTQSSVTTVTIRADFASACAFDVFAALGTNLTPGATHRLTLSNVSVGAAELLDTSTISASVVTGYPQVYYVLASTISARYASWTFTCSSPTVSPASVSAYLQFGRIFAASKWTPGVNLQYGWAMGWVDPSRKTKSRGGQTYADTLNKYRVIDLTIDYETEADLYGTALEIDRIAGTTNDILVMRDHEGVYRSQQAVFGMIMELSPIINTNFEIFQKRYVIEERL